jgi:arylsulfatase A-like enzyme
MKQQIVCIAVLAAALAGMAASTRPADAPAKPNVIFIYGDDVGFADIGVNGSKLIPTPNIDRLASEGINFTDGHCAAATCTPSRYSLLTGVHGFRDGVSILPPDAPLSISTEILTLPKLFKKAGYATGVIGKWHLGIGQDGVPTDWNGDVKPGPLEIGFDYSFLLPSTNDRVPCVYLLGHRVVNLDPADPLFVSMKLTDVQKPGSTQYPDGITNTHAMTYYQSAFGHNNSVINGIGRIGYQSGGKSALWNDETMADTFVEKAKAYIADHQDEPFMLYYAAQDVHVPRAPHPRFQGVTELGFRGDAMVQFDWAAGEILAELEKHGLAENTIVIFSSDNGPTYNDGYYDGTTVERSFKEIDRGHDASGIARGGKYQIFEGGTRIPLIIRWPGRIQPGTVSDALVNQIDFLASFASLLGIELAADEAPDSRNTLAAFCGEDPDGLQFMAEEANIRRALRAGDWKYIAASKRSKPEFLKASGSAPEEALYNLADDPSEQNNIAQAHPERTAELRGQLQKIIDSSGVRALYRK